LLIHLSAIYGLISKPDCNRLLENEPVGTFLIRFSDSNAGALAIAYTTGEAKDKVRHYMVKPEDISANKTLPDFIKERTSFVYLVRVDPHNGRLTKSPKDDILSSLYTKRKTEAQQDTRGYIQNV
jgi:hypothetical protein